MSTSVNDCVDELRLREICSGSVRVAFELRQTTVDIVSITRGDVVMSEPIMVPLHESSERAALRAAVSEIVAKAGHGAYMEAAAHGVPMQELWDMLGKHGYLGVAISEEYGGGGGGLTELAIVLEELSAGGCPEMALVVSQGIAGSVLSRHGSPDQKRRYLPGLAGGSRFAFALTEPNAGSNSHNISTAARCDGEDWLVTGTKYYISGIDHFDHLLLVARTGTDTRTGRGELTLFVIDDPQATSGLTYQAIPTALRAPERQFTVFFEDVRIPAGNVIGEVGRGLHPLFDGLNPERVLSAVISSGIARYALDKATAYARERVVWDVPIGTHQAVAHPLAEAKMELEAARLMIWRAAELFDHGLPAGEEANMAKYLASHAGVRSLDVAIQTHGGNGLADEYGLADLWGMVRLQQVAPVSSQMVLNFVAQHTLGLPRTY